jgi:hypothetical protein
MIMAESSSKKKTPELRLIKTLWGIEEPISAELFQSIKAEGYYGGEVIRLAYLFDKELLIKSLNAAGLAVVCQIHTAGGYLNEEEYVYCGAYDVETHQQDFAKQVVECRDLIHQVKMGGFINVHAGVDAWSNDEVIQFLRFCFKNITENGLGDIEVVFETHRQRIFGNPFQTREILPLISTCDEQHMFKLNADLSHWYCACERVFNADDARDAAWWPQLLELVAERCNYIHARFGWAQGPQMADPSAPECQKEVKLQTNVWKLLMQTQINKQKDASSLKGIYVSPEYGPAPYLATMPHTQQPVASLPNAVSYTKKVIEDTFASIQS